MKRLCWVLQGVGRGDTQEDPEERVWERKRGPVPFIYCPPNLVLNSDTMYFAHTSAIWVVFGGDSLSLLCSA